MEPSGPLQQILGTDKRNPVFTIYRDREGEALHVYYGGELLENVPDDRRHAQYKLLVARLYNADVNATVLGEVFGADRKTMKHWGDALKSGDPERLVRALAGRAGRRKFTSEIESYIRMRFGAIYEKTRYEYSRRILQEVEHVFGVRISSETIRPLLKELKAQALAESGSERAREKREDMCDCRGAAPEAGMEGEAVLSNDENDTAAQGCVQGGQEAADNRKESPVCCPADPEELSLCHHAGVLVFSAQLLGLEAWVDQEAGPEGSAGWLLKQWLAAILLGAVNIEQTKLLDFEDLGVLLGRTLRLRHGQRTQLNLLASPQLVQQLLRFNAQGVKAWTCSDFYYDPHTKHYTGMHHVLKGWCPSIRWADKALHMDFIHSADGCPIYVEHADNYEDMRQRFMKTLPRFRDLLAVGEKKVLTFIADRGIYAHTMFEAIIESESYHLITWQKGYEPGPFEPADVTDSFILERARNRASDLQTYRFEYIDGVWEKDARMRLLRVRATNPKGRSVQVGVLTDDSERNAQEILTLIFQRWLQENDFKYLDSHFGINEITSYGSIPYKDLKEHVAEKQMHTGAYKALSMERKQVRHKLGQALVREQRATRKNRNRTQQIHDFTQRLAEIDQQIKTSQKEISRLEFLIEHEYVRLDTRSKHLMDALKLIARNAFYAMLAPFKTMYDNFRDDHVVFRNLTQANGVIRQHADTLEAILLPTPHYPPKTRRIIQRTLEAINATHPQMPEGSGRQLRLRLGTKEEFQLAIVSEEKHPF